MHSAASSRGTASGGCETAAMNRSKTAGAWLWENGSRAVPSPGMSDSMYPGAHAASTPDKPAYIMATTGQVVTYAELDAAANRLSQLFYAHGLRPGDHVALCLENHPRYFELAWGAHYAGLIYTACSSRLTSGELAYIIDDCGAKAFLTSTYKAEQAAEIIPDTPKVQLRLMLDGTVPGYESFEEAVGAQPAEPLPN